MSEHSEYRETEFDFASQSLEEEIEAMFEENQRQDTTYSESDEIRSMFDDSIVSGVYENEMQMDQLNTHSDFSPAEIEEHLESYFRFFSRSDMDLIYMHFIGEKTQIDLQDILLKTQPAISCTVERIQKQIGIIVQMQSMLDEFIYFISDPNLRLTHRDRNILLVFFYTTSIIKTSQIIGISHMVCRARIDSAIQALKETGHEKIYLFFEYILENLNKVKKSVSEEAIVETPGKHDYSSGHISQELPF